MDKLVSTNSTGLFVEFESGGDGIATLIGDVNFQPKVNTFNSNEVNINGIHGKFYINHNDKRIDVSIDDDMIVISIYRYIIKEVNNQYELHTLKTLHIVDEFIELSLNSMKQQLYYTMLVAAMNKCLDVECTTSYYSKEE